MGLRRVLVSVAWFGREGDDLLQALAKRIVSL
jgi:hypothetical protein